MKTGKRSVRKCGVGVINLHAEYMSLSPPFMLSWSSPEMRQLQGFVLQCEYDERLVASPPTANDLSELKKTSNAKDFNSNSRL
jgi:hypothetical protein